jgi:anti-sigma factor RsiW
VLSKRFPLTVYPPRLFSRLSAKYARIKETRRNSRRGIGDTAGHALPAVLPDHAGSNRLVSLVAARQRNRQSLPRPMFNIPRLSNIARWALVIAAGLSVAQAAGTALVSATRQHAVADHARLGEATVFLARITGTAISCAPSHETGSGQKSH